MKTQRKSRDKPAGENPSSNGSQEEKDESEGGKRKRSDGDVGGVDVGGVNGVDAEIREAKGKGDVMEKVKKRNKNKKGSTADDGKSKKPGNGGDGVGKSSKDVVEREEDGNDGDQMLEGGKREGGSSADEVRATDVPSLSNKSNRDAGDGVNKRKKKKKTEKENVEKTKEQSRGREDKGVGEKINRSDDFVNKGESSKKLKEQRGDENEGAEGTAVVRVEENELRKVNKKQNVDRSKDSKSEEDNALDAEKSSGEKSQSSKKLKERNGDGNVAEKMKNNGKSNGSLSQVNPHIVLPLTGSPQKGSPNKKENGTAGMGEKPSEHKGEGKKRKSSKGEPVKVLFPTSSAQGEPKEDLRKVKKGNGDVVSVVKKKKKSREKADDKDLKGSSLPLSRVRAIVRSENVNSRFSQEAYILINKATECFIEQFCEDAFDLAAAQGLKKTFKYEYLSSLVQKLDRYDFLSDYVPEKIRAKDALAEAKAAEAGAA